MHNTIFEYVPHVGYFSFVYFFYNLKGENSRSILSESLPYTNRKNLNI